ncbi:MAG TPA: flagellar basal body L-ring protein FlgH [Terriglobales bacterium]|nr:flagellar basal body L-ring protein FlgH [Terriglobales bacterium]
MKGSFWRTFAVSMTSLFLAMPPFLLADTNKLSKQDSDQSRSAYIARAQHEAQWVAPPSLPGSLWVPGGGLSDMASDYKARNVGDIVTLTVVESTSAETTGDVNTSRAFQTSSAITALPGKLKTGGVNPLFGANSSTALKGTGETDAGDTLTTSLSGRVLAVLPNGNMVVEAERSVLINSQRETMLVRGILRPGDIAPNNTAPSTALANLEIELKGKGVVSDSISRPNVIMRTLLWLIGF